MKKSAMNLWHKKMAILSLICFCWANVCAQTEISDAAGLADISKNLSGDYKLTADIALTEAWVPIDGFTGTLDGNGHIISGLVYNNSETEKAALFATTTNATIKRLGIENANIIAKKDIGALVGIMTGGLIEECYVADSYFQGNDHVSSLVGQAVGGAKVQNCYSSAYVYCTSNNTGGIIASGKDCTLSKSYFSGMIRTAGGSQAAGLLGFVERNYKPAIDNCVNLSLLVASGGGAMRIIPNPDRPATISNNYSLSTTLVGKYDLNSLSEVTSGTTYYGKDNRHGANLPDDADAKSQTFYSTTLGWDFVNVWKMLGDGYPVFQWQKIPVNTYVINANSPDNLNLLDVTGRALRPGMELDLSKFISGHDIEMNISSDSPKIEIVSNKVKISAGTEITEEENVAINVAAVSPDFTVKGTITIKLSPGIPFPNFPLYPDGNISEVYNSGPGMAIDKETTTDEDSKMVVISATSLETFNDYITVLLDNGFTQITTNTIENNIFYLLKNEDRFYYVYFTGSKNEVRIIQDNSTRTLLADLDVAAQGTGRTEFYSYSLDYTHGEGQTSKSDYWKIDCGALIIIKLKDNSLFIIDSGHERQSSIAAQEALLKFMYEITGQEPGTMLNIRGWFFSHAHGDHVYLVYPFVTRYHEVLKVESVLFNFPSYQTMRSGYDSSTFLMKETFNKYYPDCKYAKLHTGEVFSLQGLKFEVLFTHEDAVNTMGKTTIGDFNSTSTLLKVTIDGKTFMLLGDNTSEAASNVLKMYTSAVLKSDCVQTGHHMYNDLTNLYKVIAAPLAFISNSEANMKGNEAKLAGVTNAADNVKVLYSDPFTSKITVENGEFVTENIPSYRTYFKTVELPDLDKGTTVGGNKADIDMVLTQISLLDQVIDKSITGTDGKSTNEPCSRILDGSTTTKYCTGNIPATVAWTMKQPVLLKWYVIYTANDNATYKGRNPKNWVLCGSNDGESWETIDYVENGGLKDENFVGTAFAVSNPKPYQYYAFKTFETGGATTLQYSEIGLYGEDDIQGISLPVSENELPVVIKIEGNNQISINYEGEIDQSTRLSVYNVTGQKVVDQFISTSKTFVSLPTGANILKVFNSKGCMTKKIVLN
ncbi:hypothetical protein [Coprobacter tertius]|uniref:Uncharacterized protein n=1 Tax=Coprobacter tertius TaxID=2944915 RepID=A0ABT1MDM0_9BACT|nr:hypothetical protein [Coprobacter tertius]MCP9610720.1 hypothetical protein [Coprobacter tertius]